MNAKRVEEIANAVLYEGYMLYPYRPSSVKNRQRWNFGVVYPKAYSEMQSGADSWFMQTECLLSAGAATSLSVKVRFLQAVARTIGQLHEPMDELPDGRRRGKEPDFQIVDTLQVGDQILQSWQEAVEREIVLPTFHIGHGGSAHRSALQEFSGGSEFEAIRGEDGRTAALIVRTKQAIAAEVDVHVQSVQDGLFKITALVANRSQATESISASRDAALMHSLLSAHTVLGVDGGEFVSLLDPPAPLKEIASACQNLGTWPVLVGEEAERDAMLSSPIILYDYPQIAPESPGNLFDGTEIDEILALRILTLTDDEKREMQHADARSRQILERTEALPAEHFMKLHGVLRGLRPASEEKP